MIKIIKWWRITKALERADARGDVLVYVPSWLHAEVLGLIWERKVERAVLKWAKNVNDVPLEAWKAAVTKVRDDEQ
jgi:hypothetical protein